MIDIQIVYNIFLFTYIYVPGFYYKQYHTYAEFCLCIINIDSDQIRGNDEDLIRCRLEV